MTDMMGEFEISSSIPVMRMFDEAATPAFFVDYLGFEFQWEHRFHKTAESPLYLQFRLGAEGHI